MHVTFIAVALYQLHTLLASLEMNEKVKHFLIYTFSLLDQEMFCSDLDSLLSRQVDFLGPSCQRTSLA